MKEIEQPFSLTAKFDHVLLEDRMVAIVEIRRSAAIYTALWWVAGLKNDGHLGVALQAQFAIPMSNPSEARSYILDAAGSIFNLSRQSLEGGGVSPIRLMESLELPKKLASTFLEAFEKQGLFVSQGMELNVSTGLQYEFCQLLKVPKPVEFLSTYLGLPVSTVRQRITWARNKGVLPKQRTLEGEDRAETN
jgi:hypothetical protein